MQGDRNSQENAPVQQRSNATGKSGLSISNDLEDNSSNFPNVTGNQTPLFTNSNTPLTQKLALCSVLYNQSQCSALIMKRFRSEFSRQRTLFLFNSSATILTNENLILVPATWQPSAQICALTELQPELVKWKRPSKSVLIQY